MKAYPGPFPWSLSRALSSAIRHFSLAAAVTFSLLLVLTGCGATGFSHLPSDSPAAPTVTIASSAASITAGSSATLTVAATDANQVTISGSDGSSYSLQAAGGTQVVSPKATTTYTATASGTGGKASATDTLTVAANAPPAAPAVTLSAAPAAIVNGASATLTVAATNATGLTITGTDGSTYALPPSGGNQAVTPAVTTTYTATATGASGTTAATATATVTVTAPPPPATPTVTILANPGTISAGSSSTLTVAATNATSVTLAGTDGSSYTLSPSGGTQVVSPAGNTTYTATASGAAGTTPATAVATVTVVAAPPPPPPPAAPAVTITANPASITAGSASTLMVAATNATAVTITGSDNSSYTLQPNGGAQSVSPATTTTYTAHATGATGTTPAAASTTVTVTPQAPPAPTVTLAANPASITSGGSSTLTVTATNATAVTITGSDSSSYTLQPNGGTQAVSPTTTTTYTAHASGATGTTPATASTTVTVTPQGPAAPTVTLAANPATITSGGSSTLTVTAGNATAVTITGSDNSSYTLQPNGGTQAVSPTTTTTYTAHATGATGTTPATASTTVTVSSTQPSSGSANVLTWHYDTHRSGLNPGEQALTPTNVHPATFGKLFSYLVDGYVYGQPLLVSNLTIKGASHNVLYAATENDSVYAFDADSYGAGTPLWQVSLLSSGETPQTGGPIKPYQGVTSTPVIDLATNTIYIVSAQTSSGAGASFRLNALDITTGAQKFGGPVTIHASVPATNSDSVNGIETLRNSCIQRSALLLANGNVYMGFGSCHSGWLLAYDAHNLSQVGVFNASPNMNGEGKYASAGGVWMGGGGPVADGSGNVYVTTGNGPWDGQTSYGDSVLKFDAKLNVLDYFTPQDYQFMDCQDADLAAGGLMMIPGTSQLLAGGKTGKMYLVDSGNLGHEQAGDAGATQTLFFEPDLVTPYPNSCTDASGTHTTMINPFEIFGTAAYFNGAVYLGITPTSSTAPAGVRRFTYNGKLTADSYTHDSVQQNTRGTTPFISANGNASGILWFIDEGQPIQSPAGATTATLRAFDALDLTNEVYNSSVNSGDTLGYGIKFSSPIVANGKVYLSTGHDLQTVANPQGELDVFGLK